MRDKKGRFLPNHKCLSFRNPKTGRFLSISKIDIALGRYNGMIK